MQQRGQQWTLGSNSEWKISWTKLLVSPLEPLADENIHWKLKHRFQEPCLMIYGAQMDLHAVTLDPD